MRMSWIGNGCLLQVFNLFLRVNMRSCANLFVLRSDIIKGPNQYVVYTPSSSTSASPQGI
jgi:hypothetical protein